MRRRVIDPAFWTDSKVTSVSYPARLLYIGLWQYADDEGLFIEDLKNIKMVLFPDQEFPLTESYGELTERSFFRFGTSKDGARVVEIIHFKAHQTINRPTASKLRDIVTFNDDSVNTHGALTEDSLLREVNISKDKGSEVSESESGKPTPHVYVSSSTKKRKRRPAAADPVQLAAFGKFYQKYPKHAGRAEAQMAWLKLNPDPELVETIIAKTLRYAEEMQDVEPKHIKNPQGWLNGRRWEDEATDAQRNSRNGNGAPAFVDLGDGFVDVAGMRMSRKDYDRRWGAGQ